MKIQRFWDKVNKNSPNGCWEWTASKRKPGYGAFKFGGKVYDTHRFVWNILLKHPVPDDKIVCHKCDNRICVNPDHLYLGTYQENVRDMQSRGRDNYAHGEGIGVSKLSEEKARAIRELYKTKKCSYREIGLLYKVDKSTIRDIIIGKTWKEI